MPYKVFVDGQEGTTGLKIFEYLSKLSDIEILRIDTSKRKDAEARSEYLNAADLVFLCLPDSAAQESVALVKNEKTKIINASTVFRTDRHWAYGLPELKNQRELIRSATRVSVPGCHATGFILSTRPLIEAGILPQDYPVTCNSLTGYSGAGRSGIEEYENPTIAAEKKLNVPRHYSMQLNHKHLPEMKLYSGLAYEPIFTPIKANYAQGIAMSIPLASRYMKNATAKDVHDALSAYFEGERFVHVMPYDSEAYLDEGHFMLSECNDTNQLEIFVFGQGDKINIISRYDNLGKGASGAAIQSMNLMLGFDEGNGLI
ncbi:N-acetyl-gamma-glutamyl-phosphate reductase [Paenibacillus radicis (ex Gao et al. 2016)]|uniref:N-acetyl-gamma-glutamyl-phosphate reductase n=1 Tax=Paenibacillus radicis (ex Gao et al. 2016) TaxID=1737354 RepID=A0A917M523_9BACL|nr:N-acetyl-gamma-glutamyl-phosphate reductase [Paenibacillus radicis (ex Gao et al. 2016)]GGG75897.1 N-acetyl-gamma-glutamyl-phosphate reductase [Paenibacillus radicis (ex Gao et al. 2016)]